jgi:uncharacterized protein YndB with AHSA1/START domain
MEENSITLHRIFKAPVERVFKAFIHADAMAAWLPPYGFVCEVHEMDVRVGGSYRMAFTNFSTGSTNAFGGVYLAIVPNEKLQYTDVFEDPNLPGQLTTTVVFKQVVCGTEINIIQEGIPAAIPTAMCYLGWQESLEKLKNLVEPIIPDA